MPQTRLGELTIDRVVEFEQPEFDIYEFFPDATPELLAPHLDWLVPRVLDPATDKLVMPMQTYVVRTPRHTILIDTCIGHDKTLAFRPNWHKRTGGTYLADLKALGVAPESGDYVMCTHLHPDHGGWNTRLVDGRWAPTFPNAKYVMARDELTYWEASHKHKRRWVYTESVLPVVEAGQALVVDSDHALDDNVWLEPSPGHTPGHVSVRLSSNGAGAVMCGDLIHSPIQCVYPHWNSMVCIDPEQARKTRADFLDRYCDSAVRVLTAHFPAQSIGRITPHGDAYRFVYDGEDD